MTMDWNNVFLIIAPVVLGLMMLHLLRFYRMAHESERWPKVEGQIRHAVVEKIMQNEYTMGFTHRISLKYTYVINGFTYQSKRLSLGGLAFSSEGEAQMALLQISSGKVIVYYNPDRPKIAVLKPGYNEDCHVYLQLQLAMTMMLGVGFAFYVVYF